MPLTRRGITGWLLSGVSVQLLPMVNRAHAENPMRRVRLPLDEFVQNPNMLASLRRGVSEMKKRKPSDPLSWFFQAAIHGVTDQLWQDAAKLDPAVSNVDRGKYWNQCPHNGQNSANFLPWHRAYTYHFEEIFRMHTGDDDFALPYWDYSTPSNRTFPREFGIQHLDGNEENDADDNKNPLYYESRDYYLCEYEPKVRHLPLTSLSDRAVDTSFVMAELSFFGATESSGVGGGIIDTDPSTRGLLEQSPHDQIHRSVGGIVTGTDENGKPIVAMGAMAVPATAGFDPIFCVHHTNIDRIWARWCCLPNRSWGVLPPASWFDESPWFFFDPKGTEVNRPRRDYFDYKVLGVRFKDDSAGDKPLQLPNLHLMVAKAATVPRDITYSTTLRTAHETEVPAKGVTTTVILPASPAGELAARRSIAGANLGGQSRARPETCRSFCRSVIGCFRPLQVARRSESVS